MFRVLVRTSLIAAALGILPAAGGARADDTFLLPDDDGYGIGDCLAGGPESTCGRMVADAWCESKGFLRAKGFGRADMSEVTGSVPAAPTRKATPTRVAQAPGLVTITCEK